jgi:LemA protein
MSPIWIVLIVGGVLVLWAIFSYNRLVSLREQVRAGWAQIDVLLKRRHDLIPNVVETVKGYAAHEKGTLEAVINARNAAVAARSGSDPASLAQAEGQLSGALRQLFALSEAYPDLKANTNFMDLQRELANTENQIGGQRQQYNALVAQYNTSLMSFPTNLMAGPFGFTAQPFFEIQDAAQREAPQVKF